MHRLKIKKINLLKGILYENNIPIRGGRKKKTFTIEQIEEIKQMISDGKFLVEIADYFGIDKETMKLRLTELNL